MMGYGQPGTRPYLVRGCLHPEFLSTLTLRSHRIPDPDLRARHVSQPRRMVLLLSDYEVASAERESGLVSCPR
jgi:hypothetical protein